MGAITLLLALAACGGSGGDAPDPASAGLEQLRQAASQPQSNTSELPPAMQSASAISVAAPAAPTADEFFDWAERTQPELYPGHQSNRSLPPYVFRYYPGTGVYLAVRSGQIYTLTPGNGYQLVGLGKLSDFTCRIFPARCLPPPVDTQPPVLSIVSPSSSATFTSTSATHWPRQTDPVWRWC
jgi:hypothetical protein